jgi:hypothetical protein
VITLAEQIAEALKTLMRLDAEQRQLSLFGERP